MKAVSLASSSSRGFLGTSGFIGTELARKSGDAKRLPYGSPSDQTFVALRIEEASGNSRQRFGVRLSPAAMNVVAPAPYFERIANHSKRQRTAALQNAGASC